MDLLDDKYQIIHGRKLIFLLACLFPALLSTGCTPSKQDIAKLEEVKAVWAQLPVYSGLQEVDSLTTSASGKAMISKKFRSDALYGDVKRFYVERLVPAGWEVVSDRRLKDFTGDAAGDLLEFHKGDLSLSVEYAEDGEGYGWDYAIAVRWNPTIKELFKGGLVSSPTVFQKGEETMRERSSWMIMLVVVAVVCLSNWTRGANSSAPGTKTTWEYKVISVYESSVAPPPSNPTDLHNAGMEGWELIAIRSTNHGDPRSNQVRMDYYFKR